VSQQVQVGREALPAVGVGVELHSTLAQEATAVQVALDMLW
jgi:hypothetical protein